MVGPPKHLSDLAKIEADVRITCRRCRFEEDWSTDSLAEYLRAIGGSTVWSEITRHLRCRRVGCGSPELTALPVPYARRAPNQPRRVSRLDQQLLGGAMTVLTQAAANAPGRSVVTIEVRLALLVAYAYGRDRRATRLFWERAGNAARLVSEQLNDPLAAIRLSLVQRGWLPPVVRIEGAKIWQWDSPAPPGWLAPSWNPREGEQ